MRVDVKAISLLKQQTGCSISAAKDALTKYKFDDALKFIRQDSLAKTAKLANRHAGQGLLAVHASQKFAKMLELNCETDFVGNSAPFVEVASKVLNELNPPQVTTCLSMEDLACREKDAICEILQNGMAKFKENIIFRRAVLVVPKSLSFTLGAHAHGSNMPKNYGRIASIVVLNGHGNAEIANQIAQHISGFSPKSTQELLSQEFLFGGQLIGTVLEKYKMSVEQFYRLECGEGMEKKTLNFAHEVTKQIL
jgi:elongation factor Ts